jgi:hypothetical protein
MYIKPFFSPKAGFLQPKAQIHFPCNSRSMLLSHEKANTAEPSAVKAKRKFKMFAQAMDILQLNILRKKNRLRVPLAKGLHKLQSPEEFLTILAVIQHGINHDALLLFITLHFLDLAVKQSPKGSKGILPYSEPGRHSMTAEAENLLLAKLKGPVQIQSGHGTT